jgi:hypothetical protein
MRFAVTLAICFIALVILGYPAWEKLSNSRILKERDYTFHVMHDSAILASRITSADLERQAHGEPSIYPKDLGITDTDTYIRFLKKNEIFYEPLKTNLHALSFGNVSRNDPPDTIFILSSDTMRDIHTMIHQIGVGVLDYTRGFIAFRKNGEGQFYKSTERSDTSRVGFDPPRKPTYLIQTQQH